MLPYLEVRARGGARRLVAASTVAWAAPWPLLVPAMPWSTMVTAKLLDADSPSYTHLQHHAIAIGLHVIVTRGSVRKRRPVKARTALMHLLAGAADTV